MSSAQVTLEFLIVLALAASLLLIVTRRIEWLPYPVVLALAGIGLGLVPRLPIPAIGAELILLAFVPGLVFEASLALDLQELRRHLAPVGLLASVGVGLTVLLIGAALHLGLGFPWTSALLLGAILAATDPIAVVTLLRRIGAPGGLGAILEGESLLNDGTGVAAFTAVLGSLVAGQAAGIDVISRFLLITAAGTAIGVLIGGLGALALRRIADIEVEILLTLVLAYGAYLAADLVHASGVVATVVAGLLVARFAMPAAGFMRHRLLLFWNLVAFTLNAILFLLVGVALPIASVVAVLPSVLLVYAAMVASRAAPVYLLLGATDPLVKRVPWRWRHLVFWGGIRGALSIALALSIAHDPLVDPKISTIAYGVVVLSLVVQGALLAPVARLLRLSG